MSVAARTNYANVNIGSQDPLWAGSNVHAVNADRMTIQQDPLTSTTHRVLRNIVQSGDYLFGQSGTNRSEWLVANVGGSGPGGTLDEGDRCQFGFGLMLPSGFQASGGDFNSLFDWHFPNNGPAQSPIMGIINNASSTGADFRIRLWGGPVNSNGTAGTIRNSGQEHLARLENDRWYRILCDLLVGGDGVGAFGVWIDGTSVMSFTTDFPTTVTGVPNDLYYKQGFYRSSGDGNTYGTETYWFEDTLFWDSPDETEAFSYFGWGGGPPPPPPPPPVDPIFDTIPAGYITGSYRVTGTTVHGSQPDRQRCYRATVPAGGATVVGMGTYREPQNTPGVERVRLAIWPSNAAGTDPLGGAAPLFMTDELAFTSASPLGRYEADVAVPGFLPAGPVFLGEADGETGNLAQTRKNVVVGAFRLMTAAYTSAPLPWDTVLDATYDLDFLVWAFGTPGSPPGETPVAPTNTSAPIIAGAPLVGQTLSVLSVGGWTGTPAPVFSYMWQRDVLGNLSFSNIAGANTSSYLVGVADLGSNLRVRVTATNSAGAAGPISSNAIGLVVAGLQRLVSSTNPGGIARTVGGRVVVGGGRIAGAGGGG